MATLTQWLASTLARASTQGGAQAGHAGGMAEVARMRAVLSVLVGASFTPVLHGGGADGHTALAALVSAVLAGLRADPPAAEGVPARVVGRRIMRPIMRAGPTAPIHQRQRAAVDAPYRAEEGSGSAQHLWPRSAPPALTGAEGRRRPRPLHPTRTRAAGDHAPDDQSVEDGAAGRSPAAGGKAVEPVAKTGEAPLPRQAHAGRLRRRAVGHARTMPACVLPVGLARQGLVWAAVLQPGTGDAHEQANGTASGATSGRVYGPAGHGGRWPGVLHTGAGGTGTGGMEQRPPWGDPGHHAVAMLLGHAAVAYEPDRRGQKTMRQFLASYAALPRQGLSSAPAFMLAPTLAAALVAAYGAEQGRASGLPPRSMDEKRPDVGQKPQGMNGAGLAQPAPWGMDYLRATANAVQVASMAAAPAQVQPGPAVQAHITVNASGSTPQAIGDELERRMGTLRMQARQANLGQF
ncbi:MAG: hypothetical protein ABF570_07660 [Acetobacter syzygii]